MDVADLVPGRGRVTWMFELGIRTLLFETIKNNPPGD